MRKKAPSDAGLLPDEDVDDGLLSEFLGLLLEDLLVREELPLEEDVRFFGDTGVPVLKSISVVQVVSAFVDVDDFLNLSPNRGSHMA